MGGLSGPAIKPIALRAVYQAAQAVRIPIVGIGGIATIDDVMDFLVVGATAVQIGTANFYNPTVSMQVLDALPPALRELALRRFARWWERSLPSSLYRFLFPIQPNPSSLFPAMPRVLSGIQPTGRFHWGNYFGAIRQYIDLQDKPETAFYFIADLHALTTVRDPRELRGYRLDAALDLLALGLDPNRASLFLQSDVPEVSQLCWILLSGAPMGLLERCVAYKDKKARGLRADAGLFTYPVLMAADILVYDSNLVPVGEDQVQHIEVARDLAGSFNHEYGETFVLPKEKILDRSARVPGIDGQKMSKSYGNTLAVFEDPKVLRKQIMRIVTDSRPPEQPKPPEDDHLFDLYSLFASDQQRETLAATYRRGGFGYGDVKKALADMAVEYFAAARARREELVARPEQVRQILGDGAATARKKAAEVLLRAEKACGLK